jgi:uncharacterized protein (DUF305 family)
MSMPQGLGAAKVTYTTATTHQSKNVLSLAAEIIHTQATEAAQCMNLLQHLGARPSCAAGAGAHSNQDSLQL